MTMYPNNPMNFGNPIYNPYLNNFAQNPIQIPNYQPVQMPGPHMEVQRVNGGKESAMAFSMGPNSSAILVDNNKPKIWFVTTDSSGYKAVNGFWIIPDNGEDEPPVIGKVEEEPVKTGTDDPIKALNERLDKLEERIEHYGKPDRKPSWQNKPSNAGTASGSGNDARHAANNAAAGTEQP